MTTQSNIRHPMGRNVAMVMRPWREALTSARSTALCAAIAAGLVAALAHLAAGSALAQDAAPVLETAPTGHRGAIWDIAYSRDGRMLVSASDDKTARVWDTATGQTRLVIRGEAGAVDHGKLYAAAVSADGGTVALAGNLSAAKPYGDIRLVDLATGEQTARLQGHSGVVFGLAYSPTGALLASAGRDGTAVVWSVADRKAIATLDHGKSDPERVAFLGEHHVVTIATDYKLRVFEIAGAKAVRSIDISARTNALAVSSYGDLFAVGDQTGRVQVWSWPDWKRIQEFQTGAAVTALAFGNGRRATEIVVGSGDAPYAVSLWDALKGRKLASYGGLDNVIKAVAVSPDGRFIASAGGNQNSIDIWAPEEPEKAQLRLVGGGRSVWGVGFLRTPDGNDDSGTYIAWGFDDPCPGKPSCPDMPGKLEFALRLPDARDRHLGVPLEIRDGRIVSPKGMPLDYTQTRALLEHDGAKLQRTVSPSDPERWPQLEVDRAGTRSIVSVRDESRGKDHYAYSFLPDGGAIVSGGRNNVLEIVSAQDRKVIHDLRGHESDVPAVAVSEDGLFIASGSNDQTVRLWNAKTGALIVSIHQTRSFDKAGTPHDDWIVWTPKGYFVASPGGERLVGWRISRGPDQSAEFVTAAQTRNLFLRRDVVEDAIRLAASPATVQRETARSAEPLASAANVVRDIPKLAVTSPRQDGLYRGGAVTLTLEPGPQPAPITRIEVYVRDTLVLVVTPSADDPASLGALKEVLPLFSGTNDVLIRVQNAVGLTDEERLIISHSGEGRLDRRRKAYVLAIGIDDYPNIPGNDLEFAARDAEAFAAGLLPHLRRTHMEEPSILVLSSNQTDPALRPTKANIVRSLDVLKQASVEDTVVVFVAGHGTNAGPPGYMLIPSDATWTDYDSQISWRTIQTTLDGVKARKIMFVDTCRAAHFSRERLDNNEIAGHAYTSRIAFFSSTTGQQDALEDSGLKHGYFTFALLEALSGKIVDFGREISVRDLGSFLGPRVHRLSERQQYPAFDYERTAPDFPIAKFE
ncbi:MAG: caspase family protein [Hyphomicrobiaceae bacterium]|nr:caspase family protein [Hyphomicrobiaceae bacterium]